MHRLLCLFAVVSFLWSSSAALAQNKVLIPERLERATAADAGGLLQWEE